MTIAHNQDAIHSYLQQIKETFITQQSNMVLVQDTLNNLTHSSSLLSQQVQTALQYTKNMERTAMNENQKIHALFKDTWGYITNTQTLITFQSELLLLLEVKQACLQNRITPAIISPDELLNRLLTLIPILHEHELQLSIPITDIPRY